MGMTDRQLLWRVELPLAVPEIIAGLRIATVSTVAIATLAVFAGGGGLGAEISRLEHHLPHRRRHRQRAAIGMAIAFDVLLVVAAAAASSPWRRGAGRVIAGASRSGRATARLLDSFSGAIDFIFSQRDSVGGGAQVGGLGQVGELTLEHLKVSGIALARRARCSRFRSASCSATVAQAELLGDRARQRRPGDPRARADRLPRRLRRHRDRSTSRSPSRSWASRRSSPTPSSAFRQVDREAVEAARGMGMSETADRRAGRVAARRADDHDRRAHGGDQHHRHRHDRPARGRADARRLHPQRQRLRRRGGARGRDPASRCWRSPSSSLLAGGPAGC